MAEEKRATREDLARLRIDRDAVALREPTAWRKWVLTAGLVVGFALVALLGWSLTLGRTTQVSVAYATRSEPGSAGGAVLTG
jgi:hypothetical protein